MSENDYSTIILYKEMYTIVHTVAWQGYSLILEMHLWNWCSERRFCFHEGLLIVFTQKTLNMLQHQQQLVNWQNTVFITERATNTAV